MANYRDGDRIKVREEDGRLLEGKILSIAWCGDECLLYLILDDGRTMFAGPADVVRTPSIKRNLPDWF